MDLGIGETIALIAMGTAAAGTAYESRQAGIATDKADRAKARVEALQATQQQISMRQRMLKALATQNASTLGAVGTGAPSGFGANVMRQLKEGQNDLLVSRANESAQVSLLEQAGKNAAATGTVQGITDIAGGGAKMLGFGS